MENSIKPISYTDLAIYCDRANIQYNELAQAIGVNYVTLYRIIKGLANPGKKMKRRINPFIAAHESEIRAALSEP